MSAELLAIFFSAAGLLITLGGGLFAGFAWMIRRTDAKCTEVREESREGLHQLHGELTEVTISLARLEGPRERLILPRRAVKH